jgi:hypothetical protein
MEARSMKKKLLVAILVAFLAVPALVNAEIVGWNCTDDGDHAIDMGTTTWTDNDTYYTLGMSCTQNGYPGHITGDFITDSPSDPKVLIDETVTNDTGLTWTDYHITLGMTQTFSFSNIITPDAGWTYDVTPVVAGTIPNGGGPGYVGTINYYVGSGSPILNNADGEFGFKLTFLGTVAFTAEQVPSFIPEPATMTLLCIGALALTRRKK